MGNIQEKCLSLLGVKAFHEAGYTGSRVKIMSDEKVYQKDFPNVISPKGFQSPSGSWHGTSVMTYLHLIAPDATFIAYPFGGSFGPNSYNSPCADYIKSEKVHVFTTSQTGQVNTGKQKAMQDCIDIANTVFCAAAGNEGEKGLRPESTMPTFLAIGGVDYEKNKGLSQFERVKYSSIGKDLDYMTIAEIPTNPELDSGAIGTSFCAPVFAGMIGLLQDFFIAKTGQPLSYSKVIEFINDNCVDLQDEGFDIYTGHGLFVLPNPLTIDVKKYATIKPSSVQESSTQSKTIELYIDDTNIYINGEAKQMDVAPFIENSRTFVPVKFISEALGYQVEWDGTKRKVTIKV